MSVQTAFRRFSFAGALLTGFLLLSSTAFPQATSSSTVAGLVTDQQQAAIPGAQVTLLDTSTNQPALAKTNDAGRYIFVNVNSGTYSLTITKDGFSTFKVDSLVVEIGSPATVNAVMQIGSTTTTVEVTATAAAELVTTNAAVGTTLNQQALQDLPNMGRDVSTLAVLQPGTTLGGFTAGSYNDQNTYQIDGGNASDDMAGNVTGYQTNFTGLGGTQTGGTPSANVPTPVESVEEFKVSTFNQTADFNNSIGGQVQVATKRGTNQWHGSAYGYYFATNVGAANSWANDHTPCNTFTTKCDTSNLNYTPLPSNHRDRFGTSLGGPLTPKILGGKTYFFFNYEGERFPNVGTYERLVPTAALKQGIIQIPNAAGQYVPYNLNPGPVTYNGPSLGGLTNGQVLQPAQCGTGLCDPRGLGIAPDVSTIWNKYMPSPTDYNYGSADNVNTAGYLSTVRAPLTSNAFVGRIDHDFGDNWRIMSSYRYARIINLTTSQVDIGGFFSGDKLGQPVAVAPRPQLPSFFVGGITGSIKPNLIMDLRYSYQREFWQWADQNAPPQLPGLTGAIEIAPGNSTSPESTNALIPYNVNTQSIRQRFWDAHDNYLRDDFTMVLGKHVFQFGAAYQHNFDYHTRTDNGVGTNNQLVYWTGSTYINWANSPYIPSTVPANQAANYENLYSEVLGLVTQTQLAYTRNGQLQLQPPGSSAFDKSVIPYYSEYFGDTWKLKPNLTLTYSLGYTIEMPPLEQGGKQVMVVDSAGNPIDVNGWITARKNAALQGQVYNPEVGFATVGNVAGGRKYPYNPFYGEFSPRVSAAWNPHYTDGWLGKIVGNGSTVIRGGYSRIWGRTNGVTQVLTPLLGVGLIQAVVCQDPVRGGGSCAGAAGLDPSNAFRIGVDGNTPYLPSASPTLAQPFFPGVNGNPTASDASALDPYYKPQKTDNFTISIQRQLTQKTILEVGYIGRIIKNETDQTDLDAVPYMMTLGGQQFSQAYANMYFALAGGTAPANVPVQPFLEAALGGAGSASCKAYSSCTAYVASADTSLIKGAQVSDLWAALNKAASWTLGRTMISSPALGTAINAQAASIDLQSSLGYGNYNAMYVTWRARDWHNMTVLSNFTWSKALGTAALAQYNSSYTQFDDYNLQANYGVQNFDYKFLYNFSASYHTPWFAHEKGIVGHVLGGYTVAPLFFAQSGAPVCVGYAAGSQNQAFGQSSSSSIGGPNYSSGDCTLPIVPGTQYQFSEYQNFGSNGVGTNNATGLSAFSNPSAVAANQRRCILGYDTTCGGGYGNMRGFPTWNLDANVVKEIGVWKEGRVGATLSFSFTNILNHFQPSNPGPSITSLTTFGKITGQSNTPRNLEFGLRIHF